MDQVTRQERKAKLADLRLAFEARTVAFVPELERLITEASMPLSLLRAYFYLSNQAGYVALFGIAGEVRSSEVDLESLEVRAAALKAIVGGIKEYYGGGLATRQERDAAMQAIIDFTSQLDPCIFKHIDQRQTVIEEFIKIRDGLTAIELRGESPSITVGEFLRLERSFVSTCVLLHNSLKAPTHLPRNDLDSIIVDTAARPADQAKADKYVARHSARIAEELQRNEFPGRAKVLSEMHRLPVRVFRKVLKGLGADEVAARISSLPQEYRELWSPVVVAFPEVLIQEAKLYEKWVVAFTAYCKDDPERFKFFYLDPRRYPRGFVTVEELEKRNGIRVAELQPKQMINLRYLSATADMVEIVMQLYHRADKERKRECRGTDAAILARVLLSGFYGRTWKGATSSYERQCELDPKAVYSNFTVNDHSLDLRKEEEIRAHLRAGSVLQLLSHSCVTDSYSLSLDTLTDGRSSKYRLRLKSIIEEYWWFRNSTTTQPRAPILRPWEGADRFKIAAEIYGAATPWRLIHNPNLQIRSKAMRLVRDFAIKLVRAAENSSTTCTDLLRLLQNPVYTENVLVDAMDKYEAEVDRIAQRDTAGVKVDLLIAGASADINEIVLKRGRKSRAEFQLFLERELKEAHGIRGTIRSFYVHLAAMHGALQDGVRDRLYTSEELPDLIRQLDLVCKFGVHLGILQTGYVPNRAYNEALWKMVEILMPDNREDIMSSLIGVAKTSRLKGVSLCLAAYLLDRGFVEQEFEKELLAQEIELVRSERAEKDGLGISNLVDMLRADIEVLGRMHGIVNAQRVEKLAFLDGYRSRHPFPLPHKEEQ